jgi:hypothetical protein
MNFGQTPAPRGSLPSIDLFSTNSEVLGEQGIVVWTNESKPDGKRA